MPYVGGGNTTDVLNSCTKVTQELFNWFGNKEMKGNHDKCHLLLSSDEDANIQIANVTISPVVGVK